MRLGRTIAVAGAMIAALPSAAMAQARACAVPATIAAPHPDLPTDSQPARRLAIASYTLAISWSPEYCRNRKTDARDAFQCAGTRPKFGFTLHGLWPDGEGKDWPQYCAPTAILPDPVLKAHLCATPSPQLLQHEWSKHGTCMAARPADYFERSNRLYDGLRYPDMAGLSRGPLTAAGLATAFAAANPGMTPDMMRITATRNGWLDEIWLCLSKQFRFVACPAHQGGVNPTAPLRIWRGGGR